MFYITSFVFFFLITSLSGMLFVMINYVKKEESYVKVEDVVEKIDFMALVG